MKKAKLVLLAMALIPSLLAYAGGSKDASAGAPANAPASDNNKAITIVVGESGSELTANAKGEIAFKDYVEKASNGRIKAELYFNAQLGGDRELLESTQIGQVTMMATGLTQHTNFVPELTAMDAPFLYDTEDQVYKLFQDNEFSAMINKLYESKGYHFVGMYFQGFRTLTSNRQVRTVADCRNMSIRVIQAPTPIALWKALGTNPTPLAFPEVYTALQQGLVEAQENPYELIYSQKFYEQQKYVIDTNHQIQPILMVMNLAFYKGLPDDMRKVVDDGFAACFKVIRDYIDTNTALFVKTMKDSGCTFIQLTPDARAEFKARTADVRADLAKQYPDFYKVLEGALARIK